MPRGFVQPGVNRFYRGSQARRLLNSWSALDSPRISSPYPYTREPDTSWLSSSNLLRDKQILFSTSTDPFENLAIETHLLNHTPELSKILFFYINRPCVVVGRNQNPWIECNLQAIEDGLPALGSTIQEDASPKPHPKGKEDILLVRRRSGGGTVFHDLGNLNYSFIVPNDKSFTRRKYPELVVQALKRPPWNDRRLWVNERNDIVIENENSPSKASTPLKISGSAYRITRGRAMAHGTLLFASPNLGRISNLLRSPGKGYLKAKGVESVRTPVGSLHNDVMTADSRNAITRLLVEAIADRWILEERQSHAFNLNSSSSAIVEVGSWDCRHDVNPTIADGVQELKSDTWRFEQTPRFDVDTGEVSGVRLKFHIRQAKIENVHADLDPERLQGSGPISRQQQEIARIFQERKVYQVNHWAELLAGQGLPPALAQRLTVIFPSVMTRLSDVTTVDTVKDVREVEDEGTNMIKEIPT